MTKKLVLAFNLILKRKVLNFFIIVQILFSLIFLLISVGTINMNIQAANMVGRMNLENSYYFSMFDYVKNDEEAYKMFYEEVENSKYIEEVAEIYYLYDEQREYNLLGYNHSLMHYMYADLSNEIEVILQSGAGEPIIPVIVTKDTGYKYGEIFPLIIETDIKRNEEMEMQIQCKVIRVLKSPREYLNFTRGASEGYYTPALLQGKKPRSIILPVEYLISDKEMLEKQPSGIILLNEEGSYDRLYEEFSKFGYINNMEAGTTVLSRYRSQEMLGSINILCMFVVLTLISIISCNVVQLSYNKKMLDIYYMLGMSKRQGRTIELMRNLILIMSCFGVFTILINTTSMGVGFELGDYFGAEEYRSVMLGVLVYLGVIFLIPSEVFQFFAGREIIK